MEIPMSLMKLNSWFRNLDTDKLAFLFAREYNEVMESADPKVNINTFYKEVKSIWKGMSKQEKFDLYIMSNFCEA